MTAGHCFAEDNPNNWNIEIEDFTLAFGVDDIADLDDAIKLQFLPIQTRKITKKSLHPYKTYNYPRAYNDVLVVEISKDELSVVASKTLSTHSSSEKLFPLEVSAKTY